MKIKKPNFLWSAIFLTLGICVVVISVTALIVKLDAGEPISKSVGEFLKEVDEYRKPIDTTPLYPGFSMTKDFTSMEGIEMSDGLKDSLFGSAGPKVLRVSYGLWDPPHHYDRDPWFYGIQMMIYQDNDVIWASYGDTIIVYRKNDTIAINRDGWKYIHNAPSQNHSWDWNY